jgi:hypothetical protein
MQYLLLLHLREQKRLPVKKIEQRTGIPAAKYLEYEQGSAAIGDGEAELLAVLFKIRPFYLKACSSQPEYFNSSKLVLDLKNKRIEQLTPVPKRYINPPPA